MAAQLACRKRDGGDVGISDLHSGEGGRSRSFQSTRCHVHRMSAGPAPRGGAGPGEVTGGQGQLMRMPPVTTDAVQLLGGHRCTLDYPVERMMRDAKITRNGEGANQVQCIAMARNLP
ncbi:hypothetical protein J7E94_31425 [Streptomyces sp. ISL-94]|nr:hypothetical protein [Streptomyces sp. ISL-94]